jgi:hypothetical protein
MKSDSILRHSSVFGVGSVKIVVSVLRCLLFMVYDINNDIICQGVYAVVFMP